MALFLRRTKRETVVIPKKNTSALPLCGGVALVLNLIFLQLEGIDGSVLTLFGTSRGSQVPSKLTLVPKTLLRQTNMKGFEIDVL